MTLIHKSRINWGDTTVSLLQQKKMVTIKSGGTSYLRLTISTNKEFSISSERRICGARVKVEMSHGKRRNGGARGGRARRSRSRSYNRRRSYSRSRSRSRSRSYGRDRRDGAGRRDRSYSRSPSRSRSRDRH